jgi:hypothetical protein
MGSEDKLAMDLMAAASMDEKRAALQGQQDGLAVKIQQLQHHLAIVQAATRVLSVRAFTFISLLGGLGLFGWCVADPEISRIVATSAYAGLVFLPTLYWARSTAKGE